MIFVLCLTLGLIFQELEIKFEQYEHPAVLTVESQVTNFLISDYAYSHDRPICWFIYKTIPQAKYVGDKGGGLSKNLFLKVIGKDG